MEKQNDDLDGLKANRDKILAEKKALQERLKNLEAVPIDTENWKEKAEKVVRELRDLKREMVLKETAEDYYFDTEYLDVLKTGGALNDIEFDENNDIKNEEAYFKRLKQEKPKLFTDYVDPAKEKVFTKDEILKMKPAEYAKQKDKIFTALLKGRVKK